MTILRVKTPNGDIFDVPFGVGADGKSAYEYAKEGGYTGTEVEFINMLSNISIIGVIQEDLNTHIMDKNNPHNVTADQINAASIDALSAVSTEFNNHLWDENNPHNVTANQINAVPNTRKINGRSLNSDITLDADDFGAYPSDFGYELEEALYPHLENQNNPHNVTAQHITGTFGGQVIANASAMTSLSTAQVRNIYAGTADMVAGTTELPTGSIYFVYEA